MDLPDWFWVVLYVFGGTILSSALSITIWFLKRRFPEEREEPPKWKKLAEQARARRGEQDFVQPESAYEKRWKRITAFLILICALVPFGYILYWLLTKP